LPFFSVAKTREYGVSLKKFRISLATIFIQQWTGINRAGSGLPGPLSITKNSTFITQSKRREIGTPAAVPTTTENNIAPYLLVIDDIPWLVWAGNNDDDDDIYYSRFIDHQWEPAKMVHPDNTYPDILPRLEVTATGQPVVSWEQYTDDGYILVSRTWNGTAWLAESADSQQEKMASDKEIIYSVPGRVWDGRQWIKAQPADTEKNSVEEEPLDTSTSQAGAQETIQLPDYLQQIKSVYIRFYHP